MAGSALHLLSRDSSTEYHMSGVCTGWRAFHTPKKQTNEYNRFNPRFCQLFLTVVHTWLFDTAMTSCYYWIQIDAVHIQSLIQYRVSLPPLQLIFISPENQNG